MDKISELSNRKLVNKLYFDRRRFFGMLTAWLVCAVFSFFPLVLRPMFTKVDVTVDMGYWVMIMSDNDVLYLVAAVSIIALGMAILMGKRNSMFVYLIAVLEVIAIFLAVMGYLMLEGDPYLFGEVVYKINTGFLSASVIMAIVLFITVNFRIRGGSDK